VEGRQAVRELLRAGRRAVHQLLVAEGIDAGLDEAHPMAEILALAEDKGIPVRRVPRGRIDAESGTEAPQGVIARAESVLPVDLDSLTRRDPGRPAPFLVVLDGVTDPHNLGAVMRSALGAGATGLVIGRHRAAHLTPTAVKAAAGAVEHLPVSLVTGVPAALSELVEAGVWTIGLDAGGPGSVWDLGVATESVAVVLGAEGRGLSRLTRQRCDLTVGIPLLGPLDSLNVSAAAAVVCFEVAHRRGGGEGERAEAPRVGGAGRGAAGPGGAEHDPRRAARP
jgi:23S rRNA (guanosine2251-2'-O)-methyltransferase